MTPRTRHNIKNATYLTIFIAAVIGFTFWFMTLAAKASEDHTNVVFWAIPGEFDNPPTSSNAFSNGPQDFHSYGKGKHLDTQPRIALECGNWYQVDAYVKTHPFGPGDKLTGPPMDAPHHQSPAQWRFVYGGDCPPPKPPQPEPLTGEKVAGVYECVTPANGTGVATITTTAWTQDYKWKNGAWVLGKKVYSEPVVTTEISDDVACIPDSPLPKSGTASDTHDFCTEPADGTRTYVTTETAWIADPVWSQEDGEWTHGDKVYGEPSETTEVIEDETCAAPVTEVTPEPSPEPSVTPAPDVTPDTPAAPEAPLDSTPVLAATGADTSTPLMIAAALGLVGAGVAIVRKRWTP